MDNENEHEARMRAAERDQAERDADALGGLKRPKRGSGLKAGSGAAGQRPAPAKPDPTVTAYWRGVADELSHELELDYIHKLLFREALPVIVRRFAVASNDTTASVARMLVHADQAAAQRLAVEIARIVVRIGGVKP
jgi:hypothetical protein